MEAEWEANGKRHRMVISSASEISALLDGLHPTNRPFVTVTDFPNGFAQIAGSPSRLTFEIRKNQEGGFVHLVIGRTSTATTWTSIECKVGPIYVLDNEVLDINDAKVLFSYFLQHGSFPDSYVARDVTSSFTTGQDIN
jgi:hypothetical protein